jgi:hypothetical protein
MHILLREGGRTHRWAGHYTDVDSIDSVPQSDNASSSEILQGHEFWHHHCNNSHRESVMVYWIDHNGEKLGPMKAIDVLRRARGATKVYNGETWFTIGDSPDAGSVAGSETPSRETERIVIRQAAG